MVGAGSGGSLTTRTNGEYGGTETHTLSTAEMPSHYHSAGIYDPQHNHSTTARALNNSSTGGGGFPCGDTSLGSVGYSATGVRNNSSNGLDTTYSTGGGGTHNNMSPFVAMWVKVKL
jgi:microcystin-dependent protein